MSAVMHCTLACLYRVLQPTKNPFMDTLRAVIQDVKWFLFLLVLTVWGFTCAFYILFRQDQQYEVCHEPAVQILQRVQHDRCCPSPYRISWLHVFACSNSVSDM